MKTIAIIQVRASSTRLPGKVLLKLGDKTVLEHVISRVKKAKLIDRVIVATTKDHDDEEIVKLCKGLGVGVYRGSVNDVLDRYYQASKDLHANNIVRITSDCPLIDPSIIDKTIRVHLTKKADYTASQLGKPTYPDGQDVEVIKFEVLKTCWENARLASEREHVTLYINNNPKKFKRAGLKNTVDLSKKRWTLDEKEDYRFIKIIFKNLYHKNPFFGMADVLEFLKKHPRLEKINSHIMRNEGLAKSLKEDRIVEIN